MNKKRIAFIPYDYEIENSPTIQNCAYELAEAGYVVDIFINNQQNNKNFSFKYHNVNLFVHNNQLNIHNKKLIKLFNILKNLIKKNNITYLFFIYNSIYARFYIGSKQYINFKKCLKYGKVEKNRMFLLKKYNKNIISFIDFCKSKISIYNYCYIFGIEPYGLIIAKILSNDEIPYIYLNLELNYSEKFDNSNYGKFIHYFEKMSNIDAYFTIIQDIDRAEILSKRNEINLKDIILLPVSVRGSPVYTKSDYLQNKFNLKNKIIILYAGNITDWSLCYELAKCTTNWSEDYVLVIHGYGYTESYLSRIKKVANSNGNIYISTGIVSFEELDSLVSSADIGLLFYKNIGPNFELIGSASGKLTQYLKCGLPVVCSDLKSIREVIDHYSIGDCTNQFNEIIDKINYIIKEYPKYRSNAYKCYLEKYEFSKNFKKVIEYLVV